MFAKVGLVIGGLIAAVAFIGAADAYFVRSEVISPLFAQQVLNDVLDDAELRAPAVDELTNEWIAEHPDRFELMEATTPDAHAALRKAVDDTVATAEFRAEATRSIYQLAERRDDLGVEDVVLDLGPAVDAVASDIPEDVRGAFVGEGETVLTKDLSDVSKSRALLKRVIIGGAAAGLVAALMMFGVSRSLRLTIRSVVAIGLVLAIAQPWILDRVINRVLAGYDDAYVPVVARRLDQQLDSHFTIVVVVFAVLLSFEVVAMISDRSETSRASTESPADGAADESGDERPLVMPESGGVASAETVDELVWFDPDDQSERLAS